MQILAESVYVITLLLLVPLAIYLLWRRTPDLATTSATEATVGRYGFALLGGLYGGTLFDAKWLYHGVARGSWHADRWVWRTVTPLISAGLAFTVIALMRSGLIPILDAQKVGSYPAIFGVAVLAGYFSDNTVAAMAKFANDHIGTLARTKARDALEGSKAEDGEPAADGGARPPT